MKQNEKSPLLFTSMDLRGLYRSNFFFQCYIVKKKKLKEPILWLCEEHMRSWNRGCNLPKALIFPMLALEASIILLV